MPLNRIARAVLMLTVLGFLISTPALAEGNGYGWRNGPGRALGQANGNNGRGHMPELDSGTAASAAVLLVGGTLTLLGRRRRKPQA